jgi:hypothetical protein
MRLSQCSAREKEMGHGVGQGWGSMAVSLETFEGIDGQDQKSAQESHGE